MQIKKGEWVKVHNIVLTSKERTANIPEDTKATDLEMWVKGTLLSDAKMGDKVEVETITGRKVSGTLVEVAPSYSHSFGKHVPELLKIGQDLRKILAGSK